MGRISSGSQPVGYRLGVILPKGFAFISSDVAAQMTTLPDGRLKVASPTQRPE